MQVPTEKRGATGGKRGENPAAGLDWCLSLFLSVFVHKKLRWAKVPFYSQRGLVAMQWEWRKSDNSLRNERIQCRMG